ncbi:MAG TPA: cob(I)yrinic acid a,c-diamide adenosyltransferase [Proteiniclasticum sp.]|nr:cob(I)yrinic acid a,c-diamide adenosyltransferase [Proteiniclasticum sp.]
MSKIYTKTGDKGETGLFGGSRVKKSSRRVNAYGAVDQSNAAIGAAANFMREKSLIDVVRVIQDKLFVVGGELASDEKGIEKLKIRVGKKDIEFLEKVIDEVSRSLEDKPYFVIPGKTKGSAFLHVARTQVRFAEREILFLSEEEEVSEDILKYMNRLSDTLYAMSRYEDEVMGEEKKVNYYAKEMLKDGKLTEQVAHAIMKACVTKAYEIGKPMVVSIVDDGGNLKSMMRMDGAIRGSIDISRNKAYTAAFFHTATEELGKLSGPGKDLYGIEITNRGQVVTFPGGMPLVINGKIVGGLGISGGSVEEDKAVCLSGIEILEGRGEA